MSVNLSNKLPASSHRSSSISSNDENLPSLIKVEEHLPTFTKATAANLPHHGIITEDDPPSFRLSVANQEAEQEFPLISPWTAEVLLHTHPDINNTIHTITFRLIATIHHCTLAASQKVDQFQVCKQQLWTQITSRNFKITQLQGQLGTVNIPAGFEPNLGNASNIVPLSTGECIIPHFVR